jgi:hypothetical protein
MAFHLERVQLAEIGHLLEGEGSVLDEPDCRCFRHQRWMGHWQNLLCAPLAPAGSEAPEVISDDWKVAGI